MEFTSSYFHTLYNPNLEEDFSGGGSAQAHRPCPVDDAAFTKVEKSTPRNTTPLVSVFYVPEEEMEEEHHFLDECSLCHKFLAGDIFMYRGDTPFCSEECRREQILIDKMNHRRKKQLSPQAQAQRVLRTPQLRHVQPNN